MSLRHRNGFRDAGIEWVDSLPTDWREGRLRWLARLYAGGTPNRADESFWTDGTIPWLNSGTVNQGLIKEPSAFITEDALANSSARWVPAGALVMALAGQGKTKGMVAQMGFTATCNQSMAAIVPRRGVDARYVMWWLTANYQNIRNMAGGDLRDGLNLDLLGDIGCPVPPTDEQQFIASFLDRETVKIDALVDEQRRLIELLKEKRQAVISHAVTKGLDPSVPMKDSGFEWLGEVPEHWDLVSVGRSCELLSYGFTNPMPTTDEGPYLLTANDIGENVVAYETARRTSREAFEQLLTDKSRPRRGDVLLTKDGTLGRLAVHDGRAACINQSVAVLRPRQEVVPEFLANALASEPYQGRMIFEAGGTTIKHIYVSRLAKMPFALPPRQEMTRIAKFASEQRLKLDGLSRAAADVEALLLERRAALISAAVTGEIDVRASEEGSRAA
ncbi:restriction endonuclease subunit S [Phenylobacterium sp.]|uniref:restriction endonuclease subunit S n=1 Tax=Phenylobacterium sp. TaxID=1871053 RepID=UPI0027300B82|nr:restriction endonuclease subunit S [Phenylobacterium sp.]MDP1874823.1 restriction endonuclease subunit S [Phenylobacterium sp.]